MKFGILMELQTPRPWNPESELNAWQNGLEQLEVADRIGIDYLWQVEHHFLEEYSHSSASESFLAAASQRTKRIRIWGRALPCCRRRLTTRRAWRSGSGLGSAEPGQSGIRHRRIFELFGVGCFHVPRAEKRAMWHESLGMICRMMVEEPFRGHEGKYIADAAAQRDSQADPEAASAAVDRLLAPGDHRDGVADGRWRADVWLPVTRRRREMDARLLCHAGGLSSGRLCGQS